MLDRRQALRLGLTAAAASAGDPGWAASPPQPRLIPLIERRNRFLVEVSLNGVGGYRFVLDTGATSHVISARVVAALHAPLVDTRVVRSYEGRRPEQVARLDGVSVGGVALGRSEIPVWPDARLEGNDGLIGYAFLTASTVLDLSGKMLALDAPAPPEFVAVEARVMRNQTLLSGGVPGAEGRFVFDTGAQDCTVSPAYFERIKQTPVYAEADKHMERGDDGRARVWGFQPPELRFGALTVSAPMVRVALPRDQAVFGDADALLGASLIRRYIWALDRRAGSLRAGPAPA